MRFHLGAWFRIVRSMVRRVRRVGGRGGYSGLCGLSLCYTLYYNTHHHITTGYLPRLHRFMHLHTILTHAHMDRTTIPIDSKTRDSLRALKQGGETYDDLIKRLIDERDVLKYETESP